MPDKVSLIDTNVIVYLYSDDEPGKKLAATSLLEQENIMLSRQVVNEICNVLIRKFSKSSEDVKNVLNELEDIPVLELTDKITLKTLDIVRIYRFSFWDSMLVATAIENHCEVLYSEDLQHGQIIEKRLEIINPFLKKRSHKAKK